MRNDNDDNTLVLDHIPADVGDLHGGGGMGGGRSAGFPSGDVFYDVPAVSMPTQLHYGGAYPVQHGVLPTIGSDVYHHQVYYDESNGNLLA